MKKEPLRITKSLEALRHGSKAALRENVRCMLVLLMGHKDCGAVLRGMKIPLSFPDAGLTTKEKTETAQVAFDILLELGYDAAAEELIGQSLADETQPVPFDDKYGQIRAKDALMVLEAGPPSIRIDNFIVFKKPVYRMKNPLRVTILDRFIAKAINETTRPWILFLVQPDPQTSHQMEVSDLVPKHWGSFKTLGEAKGHAEQAIRDKVAPVKIAIEWIAS